MTALSELLPSGGGQGEVNFVASGNIANGAAVVLNSNGTISTVSQIAQNIPLGSEATFNSASIDSCVVRFILNDSNKFVLAYRLNRNSYGYVVVGTISGTSISFGTPVVFKSVATGLGYSMEMDTLVANRAVIAYNYTTGGSYTSGQCITGVVSNTSISFASPSAAFNSGVSGGSPRYIDLAIDPNSSGTTKFVVGWVQYEQYKYVYFRPGYINSNGSIVNSTVCDPRYPGSVGDNAVTKWPTVTFDSKNAGNGVLTWSTDYGTAERKAYARPFFYNPNVSGALTIGAVNNYTIYGSYHTTYSPAIKANPFVGGQYVIAFGMEFTGPFIGGSVVLNVSNPGSASSTIARGSQIQFEGNQYGTYPPNGGGSQERTVSLIFSRTQPNVFVVAWSASSSTVKIRRGTITPDTNVIVYTAASTSDSGSNEWVSVDMPVTSDISIVCYQDLTNSSTGKVRLGQVLIDNVTDVVGIAGSAITSGASGPINVFGGVNTQQTSLTIGTEYYVQPNGTISTATAYPAQRLGRAVKATTINMKDLT